MVILLVTFRWLVLFLFSCISWRAGAWGDTLAFSFLVWFYDWRVAVVVSWLAFCSGPVTLCPGFHGVSWVSGLDCLVLLPSPDFSLGDLSLCIFWVIPSPVSPANVSVPLNCEPATSRHATPPSLGCPFPSSGLWRLKILGVTLKATFFSHLSLKSGEQREGWALCLNRG